MSAKPVAFIGGLGGGCRDRGNNSSFDQQTKQRSIAIVDKSRCRIGTIRRRLQRIADLHAEVHQFRIGTG